MKIHMVSNSIRMNSGFSQVTKYLALGLKSLGHEITMTGINTAFTMDYSYGIEQWPIDTKYIDETSQLIFNIRKTNPDILFYIGQLDADTNHLIRGTFPKIICYVPVEGKDIPDIMANDLRNIEKNGIVVSQCSYGHSEMKKVGILDPKMIYHGFDDRIFYRMEKFEPYCYYGTSVGQEESDHRLIYTQGCNNCSYNNTGNIEAYGVKNLCPYFKEETVSILRMMNTDVGKKWVEREIGISKLGDETRGKLVYGFVGRNFGVRKRIERLVKAYSIMISESRQIRDHTILHLHCMPIAIDGMNLIKEISKLGISDNVIFSYGATRSDAWTEQAICRLYNTFDINVSASSSEGFSLPVLEGMACGIPMIAPACSSFVELVGSERGLLANIESWQMIPDCSQRALVSENHLAMMMKKLYDDDKLRKKLGNNAEQWSMQYTWKKIVNEWDSLLKGMK